MKVFINGNEFETEQGTTLTRLLSNYGAREPFAVALNGRFVPRSQCESVQAQEGDKLELLSPVQGG